MANKAMSEVLTRFLLEFDQGKLTAIEKGVERAEKGMKKVAASVDRFGAGVKRGIKWAAGLVAAYAGLRTVRLFTTDIVDQVKVLDNWAAALNLTTHQVEELAVVAKQRGVELEALGDIMKEVGVRVGEAFLEGSKDQRQFFDELGISKKQLFDGTMQKNAREQFLVVADALAKMKDRARALQISDAMFGDVGVRGQRLLSLGREGIAKLAREAHEKGLILDQRTVEAAQRYRAVKRQTMQTLIGLRNEIASKLLPAMVSVIEGFRAWWETGDNAAKVTTALTVAVKALGVALAALGLRLAIVKLKAFAMAIAGAALAVRAFAQTVLFAASKVAVTVAPFVALFFIIRALVRFARGQEGWLQRFMGDTAAGKALQVVLEGIAETLREIGREFAPIADAIAEPLEKLAKTIGDLLAEINIDLSGVARGIATGLRWAIVAVISVVWLLLHVVLKVVQAIKWGIGQLVDLFVWLGRKAGEAADWIGEKWDALARFLLGVMASIGVFWDGLIAVMARAWNAFVGGLKTIWTGLKDFAKGIAKGIGDFFSGAAKRAGEAWTSVMKTIEKVFDFVKRKISGAITKVQDVLGVGPEGISIDVIRRITGAPTGKGGWVAAGPPLVPGPPQAGAPSVMVQTGGTRTRSATVNIGTQRFEVSGVEGDQVAGLEKVERFVRGIFRDEVNEAARDFKGEPA